MSSSWSVDDLCVLDAAYEQGLPLNATAHLLDKPESDVRRKAIELGYIESPPTAPAKDDGA